MTDETEKKPSPETANDDHAEALEAAAGAAGVDDPVDPIEPALDEPDQLALLEAENAELKDRLIRTLADLENTRKRAAREREDALKFGAGRFARDICEVADNLERAIGSVPVDTEDENVRAVLEGVRITQASLLQIFERHGVQRIEAEGQKFDPNLHEAMTEIDAPGAEPGTCVQVVETGYTLNGRLLRPARVIVARNHAEAPGSKVNTSA